MNLGRNLPPISRLLIAIACGALFASAGAARADRPQPASESKSLHEFATLSGTSPGIILDPPFPGGPIPLRSGGTLTLTGSAPGIVIKPIVLPIFPFHSGTVDLVALLRSGTISGSIDVSVGGYTPGAYTVSAVTESSSSTVVLGTLTVTTWKFPFLSGSNPIAIPEFLPVWGLSSGSAKFGTRKAPFPEGFSPFDVATISLSDSNDNVVSTATLTPVPNGYYTALSPVTGGTSAPGATGYALVHAATPPVFVPLTVAAPGPATGLTALASAAVTLDSGASSVIATPSGAGGTLTLTGNGAYTGSTTVNGGTLTLTGNPIYVNGGATLTSGPPPVLLSGSAPIIVSPLPFEPFNPPTGRIVIRAQGLPASTTLTYAADGTDLGETTTDPAGNLRVYAVQGGKGKLPPTLDLFSVTKLTVHDASGDVYLSASF